MAAEVAITQRDKYLFVHIQGDPLTLEERQSMVARTLGEAAASNLDIVVHEETSGVLPPTADQHISRANFLGTSDFRHRIAYVPSKQMPPEVLEFAINAARNQGRELRIFSRLEDAIKWIECPGEDTD